MSRLKDQVAIVTGGGSGIGLAIARALMGDGVHVVICGRNRKRLGSAVKELSGMPGTVRAVQADVSVADDIRRLIRETMNRFKRIDVLVNNAGIGKSGAVETFTVDDWNEVLDINLTGAFRFSQAVFPVMKRQKSGYLINISSVAGKIGMGGMGAYSASKFGLIGLTQSLIEEGEPYNIRATAICPGYVATPMVKGAPVAFKDMIQPEDIGRTVLYLLNLTGNVVVKEIVLDRKGAD